jgi:hypothetical protein
MSATEFDLARLLCPVDPEAFFRDTWEKRPLAVNRNAPDYYSDLLSPRDVDALIAFSRPKFLDPGDFRPSGPPAHNFVQGWLADERPFPVEVYPDVAEVQQAYARGKTVILTALQHRWPAAAALCRGLEAVFGCHVHANLYLTPPGAQGFDAHYDTHEVFVLQVAGSKHWRFYGPGRDLPLAEENATVPREHLGPPTQEAVVQAGDLLYMPRGHVHEAFTSDQASLHLTIGIKVFRWVDLLRQALDDISRRDVRFREALPAGLLAGTPAPPPPGDRFRELLRGLAESAHVGEAVEGLAADFLGKLAALPGNYFLAAEDAERLDLDTVLEKAPGVICRVVREGGQVGILYPGNRVDGPPKIASALHFIARTPRFAVRSLPDDLTAEGKLVLARRLVRGRLLTVVPPPATAPHGP